MIFYILLSCLFLTTNTLKIYCADLQHVQHIVTAAKFATSSTRNLIDFIENRIDHQKSNNPTIKETEKKIVKPQVTTKESNNKIKAATNKVSATIEVSSDAAQPYGKITNIQHTNDIALINSINKQLLVYQKLSFDEKSALAHSIPHQSNGIQNWDTFNTELDKILTIRNSRIDHISLIQDLHIAESTHNGIINDILEAINLFIIKIFGTTQLPTGSQEKHQSSADKLTVKKSSNEKLNQSDNPLVNTNQKSTSLLTEPNQIIPKFLFRDPIYVYPGVNRISSTTQLSKLNNQLDQKIETMLPKNQSVALQIIAKILNIQNDTNLQEIKAQMNAFKKATEKLSNPITFSSYDSCKDNIAFINNLLKNISYFESQATLTIKINFINKPNFIIYEDNLVNKIGNAFQQSQTSPSQIIQSMQNFSARLDALLTKIAPEIKTLTIENPEKISFAPTQSRKNPKKT